MAGFAHIDEVDGAVLFDLSVDRRDGAGSDRFGPVMAFLQDAVERRRVFEGRDLALAFGAGILKQKSGCV